MVKKLLLVSALMVGLSGCATNQETGALVGGLTGLAAGNSLGGPTGAILGAAVGAAGLGSMGKNIDNLQYSQRQYQPIQRHYSSPDVIYVVPQQYNHYFLQPSPRHYHRYY